MKFSLFESAKSLLRLSECVIGKWARRGEVSWGVVKETTPPRPRGLRPIPLCHQKSRKRIWERVVLAPLLYRHSVEIWMRHSFHCLLCTGWLVCVKCWMYCLILIWTIHKQLLKAEEVKLKFISRWQDYQRMFFSMDPSCSMNEVFLLGSALSSSLTPLLSCWSPCGGAWTFPKKMTTVTILTIMTTVTLRK